MNNLLTFGAQPERDHLMCGAQTIRQAGSSLLVCSLEISGQNQFFLVVTVLKNPLVSQGSSSRARNLLISSVIENLIGVRR